MGIFAKRHLKNYGLVRKWRKLEIFWKTSPASAGRARNIQRKVAMDARVEWSIKRDLKNFLRVVLVLKISSNYQKSIFMKNAVAENIESRRTIRKFDHERDVPVEEMEEMVKLASLAPSRLNDQPLEYGIIKDPKVCAAIFANILWGIRNKANVVFADPNFAPNAYIAILLNQRIRDKGHEYDVGASAENIMLYAHSLGIGSVFLHALNRPKIAEIFGVPETHRVDSLVGLGYSAHTSTIVPVESSTSYTLDLDHNIVLPKRDAQSITHRDHYGRK